MSIRITKDMITFGRPFTLSTLDGVQPPGTYRVVVEEEEISGTSFIGFHRIATRLYLPAINSARASFEVFQVEPAELAAALELDRQTKA